jgi:RNA 2',3'-cyclic 3'-phosphodiesterase
MRAFLAIAVNDAVRAELARMQQTLGRTPAKVKWVEPANLHLTMQFLGEIDTAQADAVAAAMAGAAEGFEPFACRIEGLGCFPPNGLPRVVWAGVGQGAEAILRLHAALEQRLVPLGFEAERRFVPHVTLGRVKSPRGAGELAAAVERQRPAAFGACRVEAVMLYRSELTPQGAVYHKVAKQTLV